VEFFSGAKHWCDVVLLSSLFKVVHDTTNTDGGVGLVALFSCKAEVIVPHLIGVLEPCTRSQTTLLMDVFKFKSLFQRRYDGFVEILYRPASLLNNDNSSVTFMDRRYRSNKLITWDVYRSVLVGPNDWEVVELKTVKGVYLHSLDSLICFSLGEQILVNYQDPNFVDLTNDSDDDCNKNVTPIRKKAKGTENQRYSFAVSTGSCSRAQF